MRVTGDSYGVLLTTGASLIWGTVFVSIGIGLRYFDPYSLLLLRFVVASAVILGLVVPLSKSLSLGRELRSGAVWLVGGIYALGFVLQYVGQDLTNASHTTLLSNLAPTMVPIGAFLLLGDRIGNAQKAATGLGLVGLFLMASPNLALGYDELLGDLLLFGTSISYTLFILLSKRLTSGSFGTSLAVILAVTLFVTPAGLLLGDITAFNLNVEPIAWLSVFWMAVPCTVVALVLFLEGLSAISASGSATLLLIQVVTGLVLASILLGEILTPPELMGALSILVAVILASKDAAA